LLNLFSPNIGFKNDIVENINGTTKTKNYRYIPVKEAIDHDHDTHAVLPFDWMEEVIQRATVIAVAHCPCRVIADLLERRRCHHPLEACLKYDELATYVIERRMGREITKSEALEIIWKSEEAGLVHMVDNALEAIKQLCRDIGIPEKFRDIGVTEDKIPEMARLAFEANYNRWNPRYTTYEDFLALFERAY
jgi:hypothetical protein